MRSTDLESSEATAGSPGGHPAARQRDERVLPLGVVFGLLLSIVWSVGCDLVLEYSVWWGSEWFGPLHMLGWYAAGIVYTWTWFLLIYTLSCRVWVACATTLSACLALGLVNHFKITILHEPVFPSDAVFLSQPSMFLSLIPWWALPTLIAALCLIAISLKLAASALRATLRHEVATGETRSIRSRTAVALVLAALLATSVTFNNWSLNPWGRLFNTGSSRWVSWDPMMNYRVNGFVGGFLSNMPRAVMAEPTGYGQDAMDKITERYAATTPTLDSYAPAPNLVIILSEGFSDPTRLNGFDLSEDPIPHTRELLRRTWSGSITTPTYGHGTSTAEFEVLTGQTTALFSRHMSVPPYQSLVPEHAPFPSVAGWAEKHGYKTTAIHPFSPRTYRRTASYKSLGFSEFIYDEKMTHRNHLENNPYISDGSAFEQVIDQLEEDKEPSLVHLVTMQNHVPVTDDYENPIAVKGAPEGESDSIGAYARGLSYSDAAIQRFLNHVKGLDEPTVVVFFGDHLPPIYSPRVLEANPEELMHQTPFFIWSSGGQSHRNLGLRSPTQLLPLAFARADLRLPPYYRLLDEVGDEVGALQGAQIFDGHGGSRGLAELQGRQANLLQDLRLTQYDFALGSRSGLEELWY